MPTRESLKNRGRARSAASQSCRDPDRAAQPLRQQILETARALLNDQGAAALSMREVARQAKVTHQAPYHHFGDRESILAALVTRGFDDLAQGLRRAIDRHIDHGARAVAQACAEAYVAFAHAEPGVFRVMFSPDLCDPARFPEALAAGQHAHAELERMVETIHGKQKDETMQDLHWAYVHGLSSLLSDGPLALRYATRSARQAHARRVSRLFASLIAPAA